jgi:hypothetical protein
MDGLPYRDRELAKDFFELRALHDQRSEKGIGGFLNLNIVNEKDFYREYSPYRNLRISRFLESTGEVSLPLESSRAYLLSQYWIDLKEETKSVSQRLPEAGYVLNPAKFGSFGFQRQLSPISGAMSCMDKGLISFRRFTAVISSSHEHSD